MGGRMSKKRIIITIAFLIAALVILGGSLCLPKMKTIKSNKTENSVTGPSADTGILPKETPLDERKDDVIKSVPVYTDGPKPAMTPDATDPEAQAEQKIEIVETMEPDIVFEEPVATASGEISADEAKEEYDTDSSKAESATTSSEIIETDTNNWSESFILPEDDLF